jgi:hypothetical protein
MKYNKKKLIAISQKVEKKTPLTPEEITYLLEFEKTDKNNKLVSWLKKMAVPASLGFGFLFTAFPQDFEKFIKTLPPWTNFSPTVLTGVDYLWDLIGDPVRQANILYHVPNIVLYSFGIIGVKKLIDAIDHRTWLDKVLQSQHIIQENINDGLIQLSMQNGHSLLFVGKGDFIGMQFALNHKKNETVTISENKPHYTQFWNYYDIETLYEDLKNVIIRSDGKTTGEYIFFPVKDDQIFLPGEKSYDLSPHKLDILCQNIRIIEKESGWTEKRIIIIGDKFHKSFVHSEDQENIIEKSEDTISLDSISQKYTSVDLIEPTEIVLERIVNIGVGRKIVVWA